MKAYIVPETYRIFCENISLICTTMSPQPHDEYSPGHQLSLPDFLPNTLDHEEFEG